MPDPGTMITLLNFLARFGPDSVFQLLELLNDGQRTHLEIAQAWKCDRTNLTRFINSHMDRPYILKSHVWEYCESLEASRRTRFDGASRHRRHLLRLITPDDPHVPASPETPRQ